MSQTCCHIMPLFWQDSKWAGSKVGERGRGTGKVCEPGLKTMDRCYIVISILYLKHGLTWLTLVLVKAVFPNGGLWTLGGLRVDEKGIMKLIYKLKWLHN